MSNQPVYRTRNHAYSCRCGRCPQSRPTEWGIIGPAIGIMFAVALVGFWPAMVWHGYTDTGGWRWDIHSTIGELVYFGVIALFSLLIWAGHRMPADRKMERELAWQPPPDAPPMSSLPEVAAVIATPPCYHLNAVPVDLSTGERVAWWCAACETQFPAESGLLARPCCGSAPGTPHLYNCPQGDPR